MCIELKDPGWKETQRDSNREGVNSDPHAAISL